jgi:hypothetical protein
LLLRVMTKVGRTLGLRLVNHYGLVAWLDVEPDIILLPHSLLRGPLNRPYRAIRLIRDPRDIWVSGYFYHLHCDEDWCRNVPTHSASPIQWPQVDYSVAHRPEDWKRRYLAGLNGRSYQANLLERTLPDGLDFELEGYTGWTLSSMREWALNGADALDVRLEDVMANFDSAMLRIFTHFGFTADQSHAALEVARSEDIRRMDEAAIAERPQIQSRTISRWRDVLSAAQITRFEGRYGDLIRELGYGLGDVIPRGPVQATKTTTDAGIRLSADGLCIRPTTVGEGIYVFVVPSGKRRVLLESRVGMPAEVCELRPGDRRLGVRLYRIGIRSDAGDVVIAADDPRLIAGWHDAEQRGPELCRWTDGSAEVPWHGVSGPAVMTVRCGTLAQYVLDDANVSKTPAVQDGGEGKAWEAASDCRKILQLEQRVRDISL